ncbi:hypothetical protein D3C86_1659710 [compost metagenome]
MHIELLLTGFFFQVFERIDTVLGFRSACFRLLSDPFQLLAHEVTRLVDRSCFEFFALSLFFEEIRVVSFIGIGRTMVQFEHLITNSVEEIPVVGYYQ